MKRYLSILLLTAAPLNFLFGMQQTNPILSEADSRNQALALLQSQADHEDSVFAAAISAKETELKKQTTTVQTLKDELEEYVRTFQLGEAKRKQTLGVAELSLKEITTALAALRRERVDRAQNHSTRITRMLTDTSGAEEFILIQTPDPTASGPTTLRTNSFSGIETAVTTVLNGLYYAGNAAVQAVAARSGGQPEGSHYPPNPHDD